MNKWIWLIPSFLCYGLAQAKPAFTGKDFSGVYDCVGDDAHEGKYKGTVTMGLIREQSLGKYGAYSFKLEAPDYGVYLGEAAADGNKVAMHFTLSALNSADFGTGIATIRKNKAGKLSFRKFYYEPQYKGGNYGVEDCVKR